MKRIMAILLALVLVGCSEAKPTTKAVSTPKAVYRVVATTTEGKYIYDKDIHDIWSLVILNREKYTPDFLTIDHYPETQEVDGLTERLYTIRSTYKHDGKEYGNKMLIQFTEGKKFNVIRYQNWPTGK